MDQGSAPSRDRRRRAWRGLAVSLAMHGALVAMFLGTAWGVARAREVDEEPPVVLAADFRDPAPVSPEAATPASAEREPPPRSMTDAGQSRADATQDALLDRLRALERAGGTNPDLDALARRFGASDADSLPQAPARPLAGASFAGLVSGNATKVAYVVDASGSMVGRFPAIVDEVERSLARLEPTQSFAIVCFRRDGASSPGGGVTLRPASRAARAEAVRWLREEVVPSGRSSPVEALALALRSGADCVFLLSSTNTGPASHELDRESMLALLERLNPREKPSGRRRATIQCIQFLEPDPGGTLEAVAAEHFGPGGYRFIPRSETSLDTSSTRTNAP